MTRAELEQAFPWLGTDEPANGSDVIDKLNQLYEKVRFGPPQVIWIVRYTHRHGTDLWAFSTEIAAELAAQEVAEREADEMGSEYTEPDWSIWNEQTGDREFIEIASVALDQ